MKFEPLTGIHKTTSPYGMVISSQSKKALIQAVKDHLRYMETQKAQNA